jgi:four helix bundle protein
MSAIRTFKDLDAWKVGMDVIDATYSITTRFPSDERFGLVSQMRRAAVSVPSNVAEGQAVKSYRWSLRHVVIAIGSLAELQTQLEAAVRLKFITEADAAPIDSLLQRCQQILYGLRREKERRLATGAASVLVAVVAVATLLL